MRSNARLDARAARGQSAGLGCLPMVVLMIGVGVVLFSADRLLAAEVQRTAAYEGCVTRAGKDKTKLQVCMTAEQQRHDKVLNEAYQCLKAKLPKDDFVTLRDKQRAWIASKDANCNSQNHPYSQADCLLQWTETKAESLRSYADALQCDVAAPTAEAVAERSGTGGTSPDILGLMPGMTAAQIADRLPKAHKSVRMSTLDTDVKYYGTGNAGTVRVDYTYFQAWRYREQGFEDFIEILKGPNDVVTSITRQMVYDTYRDNAKAPLYREVFDALITKYGKPQLTDGRDTGVVSGSIVWVIARGDTRTSTMNASDVCPREAIPRIKNGWSNGVSSVQEHDRYMAFYGGKDTPCGSVIEAKYRLDGDLLRSLKLTVFSVTENLRMADSVHHWLKAESAKRMDAARQNAVKAPKF